MSKPKELPNGLREYINNVRDRLISGDLTRDSEEMATIKTKLKGESSICGAIKGNNTVCTHPPTNEKISVVKCMEDVAQELKPRRENV